MKTDHYRILGVPKDATSQDIKRAFRKIARECHPDVVGEEPEAMDRFRQARAAYETLMDPVSRARYDRRGQRRRGLQGGSFFDAFYRRTGEVQAARQREASTRQQRARANPAAPANDLGLDDLLDGFGGGRSKAKPAPSTEGPRPTPGRDVHIEVDLPAAVAREGGVITASYHRMRRSASWVPGSSDPGLVRVEDIAEIRILPGTQDQALLTENGRGDAGPHGGPAGDLRVRVRVVGSVEAAPVAPVGEEIRVDIGLVEAVLGGRITVDTPQGPVRLTVPPGTSSHGRMRLRGKGPDDAQGQPTDLYISFRVVVPRRLDAESRALLERFAELNPQADPD